MKKSILICLAHPDDEVNCAPLVKKYVTEESAEATLICATYGDVGTVEEKYLQQSASIAELRQAELQRAAQAAGYTEVVAWGYRDSGMMGSKDNLESSSFWQAPLEEVAQRVVEVMRHKRPQVVITFNTYGIYGHPDHIKINQATLAAFQQLQTEPEHPQKLYYVTISRLFINFALLILKLLRKDPRKMGVNGDMDMLAAVESLTPTTTRVPVGKYKSAAWAAADSYPSQIKTSGVQRFFRRFTGGSVSLSRVYPELRAGEAIEHDIFASL